MPPRVQLVGFTTAGFQGDEGVLGYTRACQQEFPESRMCTSVEVLETTDVPALSGDAWVRPVSQVSDSVALDASGVKSDSCWIFWRGMTPLA